MLDQLLRGTANWLPPGRLTPQTTYWQGVLDWPRPDNAFQDSTTGASLAIEFKPPGHGKSEYVRGLGQALTYLRTFEFAVLVIPRLAADGFEIAQYMAEVLSDDAASRLSVGLFSFDEDPNNLQARITVRLRAEKPPPIPRAERKVFWAYWRDLSPHDLFEILKLLDQKDQTFDEAYPLFWSRFRQRGKARTWEGKPRKRPTPGKRFSSELANDQLSLRHIGLIDSRKRLTSDGYELLRHGKVYGPDSQSFRAALGRHILVDGRHLELIFWVEETQRLISAADKGDSTTFLRRLDEALEQAGIIPRIPAADGKPSFVRDEPKVWNKLGLLVRKSPERYFFEGEGYRFDWRRIISMVNYE
ncbi:MAG TPA: hypothetical protein VJ783_26210 [Pirellulales bacterium]|nr:hypothetical protein [Pirellulales bacterium]